MTDDLLVLNLHEPYDESVAQRFPYEIHMVNVVKMSIQKPSPRAKADMAGNAMPSMQQVLTILEGRLFNVGCVGQDLASRSFKSTDETACQALAVQTLDNNCALSRAAQLPVVDKGRSQLCKNRSRLPDQLNELAEVLKWCVALVAMEGFRGDFLALCASCQA